MKCSPYPLVEQLNATQVKYQEKASHNADFYKRDGYKNWTAQEPGQMGNLKIGEPGAYYGPTPKHLPNPNKYEVPNDFTVTLEVKGVNKVVDEELLRRNCAKSGMNWIDSKFSYNPITNKRNGTGVVHLRTKNEDELQKIEKIMIDQGMEVNRS